MLRRTGLFGQDTRGATVTRACTFDDLSQAFRLVHSVYLRSGYITPEPGGMRIRIFETLAENATFIARKDGCVIGVLSIVADSADLGLPSDHVFRSELDSLRARGARLCELTNQAVADEYRKSAIPTELMRCALAHAMDCGFDEGVATVSPGHNGFYDLLGFRQVGAQRSYSEKLDDPVIALSLSFSRFQPHAETVTATDRFLHRFLREDNPFFSHVTRWACEARSNFLDPEMLARLFVRERNFIAECSADLLAILQRRWGDELFQAVVETWPKSREMARRSARSAAGAFWRRLVREFDAGVVEPLEVIADFVLPPIEKGMAAFGSMALFLLLGGRDDQTADSPAEV